MMTRYRKRFAAIVIAGLWLLLLGVAQAAPLATAVDSIGIPVTDADRSVHFYTDVLSFHKVADREVAGESYEHLFGVFGLRLRMVRMQLGDESIELMQFLAPRGRPLPADFHANDHWFQHVAVIVSDMDRAYGTLREHNVEHASTGPQLLPAWNPNAGGISAFYFRDPDGNHLEILHFPAGKGAPKWQSKERLFLGIDHTAIVVASTDASLRFYRDTLGLQDRGHQRELRHRAGAPQQRVWRQASHHGAACGLGSGCRAARVPRSAHGPRGARRYAGQRSLALADQHARGRRRSCRGRRAGRGIPLGLERSRNARSEHARLLARHARARSGRSRDQPGIAVTPTSALKRSAQRSARRARIVVRYPAQEGRIVLRTESEWTRDIEPAESNIDRTEWRFELPIEGAHVYFKPLLVRGDDRRWSVGHNYLALTHMGTERTVYPYFHEDQRCAECEMNERDDGAGRRRRFRVFYPPGYHENTLKRYPVLYMQDGQNLFFPNEAFQGNHWRVAETLRTLDAMNVIDKAIVVGIHPNEREHDYTQPGYEAYGRFLTAVVKPFIDSEYRTLAGPVHTAVMGSSLGGVVSLYLAWQYPQVFGMAAAMSSTFGWRDDLAERVASERRRPIRIYLDSGWPHDNYEVTRNMHALLKRRGYRDGIDLDYLSFPDAVHNEQHWAMRAHIPFQLFFGATRSQPT